jgi:pilus assembly protein Flp/PilA
MQLKLFSILQRYICSRSGSTWSKKSSENHLEFKEHNMKLVARFVKNESGATAIEYGLIAALISVAIISAATTLGSDIATTFGKVSAQLTK